MADNEKIGVITPVKPEKETNEKKSIYEILEDDIVSSDLPEADKTKQLSKLLRIRSKEVNILIVGATGVGKSSTINALFDVEVAKVGMGVDPETDLIESYHMDNLTIWDSPGLGDGFDDKKIRHQLITKLNEANKDDEAIIDLVVLLIDASSKDLGTTYDLLNTILKPCFGKEAEKRIVVALNQSDMAMKGHHWDDEKNEPDPTLAAYLEKKVASVAKRIKETTGLKLEPIYFCAGYVDSENEVRRPYNLTKLLYQIVKSVPVSKRLALFDNISSNPENWMDDDQKEDYTEKTIKSFFETVTECISECAGYGRQIGNDLLGLPGQLIGGLLGGTIGAIKGIFSQIFN